MSSDKYSRMLDAHPEWASDLATLRTSLAGFSKRQPVSPTVLDHLTGLGLAKVLAYLNVLRKAGLGEIRLHVTDARGRVVGDYESVASLPAAVEDDFGERTIVSTENTQLVFVPSV